MWNNKKLILVTVLGAFVLFLIIWLIFITNGPFSVGKHLEKRDWLSFLSGFLSFAGTIIITTVIIIQNHRYKEMDLERLRLQNMPNLKFKKVDLYTEFEFQTLNSLKNKTLNPQHRSVLKQSGISGHEMVSVVDDCPLIIMKNDKLEIQGDMGGQRIFLKNEVDRMAILSVTNHGIGPAMTIKAKLNKEGNNQAFNYDGVILRENEKLYFEIDLKSIADKGNIEFNVIFSFVDIFASKYKQEMSFNMTVKGRNYTFKLDNLDAKPILIK